MISVMILLCLMGACMLAYFVCPCSVVRNCQIFERERERERERCATLSIYTDKDTEREREKEIKLVSN